MVWSLSLGAGVEDGAQLLLQCGLRRILYGLVYNLGGHLPSRRLCDAVISSRLCVHSLHHRRLGRRLLWLRLWLCVLGVLELLLGPARSDFRLHQIAASMDWELADLRIPDHPPSAGIYSRLYAFELRH